MREVIQSLNKKTLADATGISYSRLRKYSAGVVEKLTDKEKEAIVKYLNTLSRIIEGETNE